jgi:hypothetical protein
MNQLHRFHCDFGEATCTIEFDAADYRRGDQKSIRPQVKWEGLRTAEMFPQFLEWIHTVNATISKAINHRHVYVVQDWLSEPPHWEVWIYYPDGDKKCVEVGYGVFDPAKIGR